MRRSIVWLVVVCGAVLFPAAPTMGKPATGEADPAPAPASVGPMFESIAVPGVTDIAEGTNSAAFADFDGNGYLDIVTVSTPSFALDKGEGDGVRDRLRLLMNYGTWRFREHKLDLFGSPKTPTDFGQGWRGSQVVAPADFDADGRLDLFVTRQVNAVHGRVRDGFEPIGCSLHLARGAFWRFDDVSEETRPLNAMAYNRQSSLGDVNGDGYIDIALGADNTTSAFEGLPQQALLVFRPDGERFTDGVFEDIGAAGKIPDFGGFHRDPAKDTAGPNISLRDLDNDGDLDMVHSAHVLFNGTWDQRRLPLAPATYRQGVWTWRNRLAETGGFRFAKVTGNGLATEARLRYDADQGLYVPASDARAPGLAYLLLADVDNDGRLDALAVDGTDRQFTPKVEDVGGRFWRNLGDFRFEEATAAAGLESLNWTYAQWHEFHGIEPGRLAQTRLSPPRQHTGAQPGLPRFRPIDLRPYHADVIFGDFDNDTWIDIVVPDRFELRSMQTRPILYMNRGGGRFEPVPSAISGLGESGLAGEAVDLDNDGRLDLYLTGDPDNSNAAGDGGPERYVDKVFRNTGARGADNHWLRLRFSGATHAALLGGRVEVFAAESGKRLGTRIITTNRSYRTGSPLETHFGLGTTPVVDVRVTLPGRDPVDVKGVRGNRFLGLDVAAGEVSAVSTRSDEADHLDPPVTTDEVRRIKLDGADRYFRVVRPASYAPGNPAVVVLHGGLQSMRKVVAETSTGARWLELAERDGFLLLLPNGKGARGGSADGDRQVWNDLRPGDDGRRSMADDVTFIKAIIDWAIEAHGADATRVFAAGSSNGGMMTLRLLVEAPEYLAAGAAFIASLPAGDFPKPSSPTPLLMINGTADPLVPWEGGRVAGRGDPVRSVMATIRYWCALHGIDPDDVKPEELPDAADDGCRVTRYRYTDKAGADEPAPVVLYRVAGGGHSIPDRTPPARPAAVTRMIGTTCRDIDGIDTAWTFLAQFGSPTRRKPVRGIKTDPVVPNGE
jgi:poly(3-hydroxybutyrate) depolymerase